MPSRWLTIDEFNAFMERVYAAGQNACPMIATALSDVEVSTNNSVILRRIPMEREFVVKVKGDNLDSFIDDYKPSCEIVRCVNCAKRGKPECENKYGSGHDNFFCAAGVNKTEA